MNEKHAVRKWPITESDYLLSEAERDRLRESNKELLQALVELLRVDDEWHGAVNSEMSHARSRARAAIERGKQ